MTTTNTTVAVWCEWIKIMSILFGQIGKKYFGVLPNLSNSVCVLWDEKGWKSLVYMPVWLSIHPSIHPPTHPHMHTNTYTTILTNQIEEKGKSLSFDNCWLIYLEFCCNFWSFCKSLWSSHAASLSFTASFEELLLESSNNSRISELDSNSLSLIMF